MLRHIQSRFHINDNLRANPASSNNSYSFAIRVSVSIIEFELICGTLRNRCAVSRGDRPNSWCVGVAEWPTSWHTAKLPSVRPFSHLFASASQRFRALSRLGAARRLLSRDLLATRPARTSLAISYIYGSHELPTIFVVLAPFSVSHLSAIWKKKSYLVSHIFLHIFFKHKSSNFMFAINAETLS